MVNLVGLLVILIIVLVIGIVGVTWADAPSQLKSFAWALIAGAGIGLLIVIGILFLDSRR